MIKAPLKSFLLLLGVFFSISLFSQEEDLLSLLDDEETTDFTTATFKANRIINLHSIENTANGVLDFKISHRFGFVNTGIKEFFGLDQAITRIGFDYGMTNNFMIGVGRSTHEKTIDGYFKYRILRQSSGAKNIPLTISAFASMAIKTIPFNDPVPNEFQSRLAYTYQLLFARKFSEGLSLQFSPSFVHRNLVETSIEENDVIALAFGGRIKLSNRTSLNLEYIYVPSDQLAPQYKNSFSIGFDIETGGHVFQLHMTNSTPMNESGFITETKGEFWEGDIHFGFNISRVFTLKKPKEFRD